jgi:tripartite-type tricarboxylate transporter receptor subunit TctC
MKKIGFLLVIMMVFSTYVFASGEAEKVTYPIKTLKVVVPYSAGGGSDVFARNVGRSLDLKKQAYVVTNIAGAGGSLGVTEVLNSRPDGYTALFHSITALVGGYYSGIYDRKIYESFEPIASVFASYYGVCLKANTPFKTLDDLIKYTKANPGKLSMAVAGLGGAAHIVALNFADAAGIRFNIVPYPGAADVRAAIEGGHADVAVLATMESLDFIKAGKLIQLAHSAPKPIASVGAPTFIQCGINFTFTHRNGFLMLKGTPKGVIDYLETEIKKVSEKSDFISTTEASGAFVDFLGAKAFKEYLNILDSMIEPFANLMK